MLCCHDTGFHLKLTILKPWVNQYIFYGNVYHKAMLIYPRFCKFRQMAQPTYSLFPNLCKRNYLFGNLPFHKIQVNRFMAGDELSGAILNFKRFPSFHYSRLEFKSRKSRNTWSNERVTGRKARGLQVEKGGCRCQTFFSLKRREQASQRYVFFPVQI